jgi:hypothetical protein
MSLIDCPVCSELAADFVDVSDAGSCFECKHCGRFAVSEASAMSLGRYTGPMRRGLLNAAILRTPPGGLPLISHVD